nr:GH184 muramidase [Aspergillus niveus]
MLYLFLTALSFAATAPLVGAYPITGDGVNCRSGPGTSHAVVKSYPKGHEISIVCQAAGTDVKGDDLWDKTSDGCYVADYYVKTGTTGYVTKHCDGGSDGGSSGGSGNLPGLTATQSSHAHKIIGEAKKEGLGRQGCLAGIATALVESNILVYANSKVPASLNYPHDAVGHDYDSVGIFQQRAVYYPDIAADMDPARSAAQFFAKMKNISGWKTMDVGKLCQKVQVSAYPDRYAERVPAAEKICSAGGL